MAEEGKHKKWLPLESNPEVLNNFVEKLGLQGSFAFTDIYGLDEVRTSHSPADLPDPC